MSVITVVTKKQFNIKVAWKINFSSDTIAPKFRYSKTKVHMSKSTKGCQIIILFTFVQFDCKDFAENIKKVYNMHNNNNTAKQ